MAEYWLRVAGFAFWIQVQFLPLHLSATRGSVSRRLSAGAYKFHWLSPAVLYDKLDVLLSSPAVVVVAVVCAFCVVASVVWLLCLPRPALPWPALAVPLPLTCQRVSRRVARMSHKPQQQQPPTSSTKPSHPCPGHPSSAQVKCEAETKQKPPKTNCRYTTPGLKAASAVPLPLLATAPSPTSTTTSAPAPAAAYLWYKQILICIYNDIPQFLVAILELRIASIYGACFSHF